MLSLIRVRVFIASFVSSFIIYTIKVQSSNIKYQILSIFSLEYKSLSAPMLTVIQYLLADWKWGKGECKEWLGVSPSPLQLVYLYLES